MTPVSISTLRAPKARAAAMSVSSPSPIITACEASPPTVRAASSSSSGAGFPIDSGVTPVVASSAAATCRPRGGARAPSG